jgi:uracil-DNA glycosylase
VLWKHTLGILENLAELKIPMGVMSEQRIANDTYTMLPIYHPSPINPKSMAWNENIVKDNESELKKMFE